MSALPPEGTVQTPAATPDTAGLGSGNVEQTAETAAPASMSEIWSRIGEDQPTPEVPAVATPAEAVQTPASTDSAVPPQPEDPDAKFDKVDPANAKAVDFQGLRARRDELKSKLQLVEPIAQKVQSLGDPGVIDIIAPLFQEHADDAERNAAGQAVVDGLLTYDDEVANSLAAGIYVRYKDWLVEQALSSQGINSAELASFREWKQTGGAVKTVYAPTGFPEANRDGYVVLPNGVELNIGTPDDPTTGDPTHRVTYELAKENWETKQAQAARDTEAARRDAETAKQQQDAVISQRQTQWSNGEIKAFEEFQSKNPIQVEEGQEQAELMVMGVFEYLIGEDNDLRKWTSQGADLAGKGAARANVLAMQSRERTQGHYLKARETVTKMFTELTSLRRIVAGGKVQTAPRLPADTVPNYETSQLPPPPPSPAGDSTVQGIWQKHVANLPG